MEVNKNRFKKELTAKELKKSGADKSKNFNVLETFAKIGMKGLVKKAMCQAPPFYYAGFSEEQKEDIRKKQYGSRLRKALIIFI